MRGKIMRGANREWSPPAPPKPHHQGSHILHGLNKGADGLQLCFFSGLSSEITKVPGGPIKIGNEVVLYHACLPSRHMITDWSRPQAKGTDGRWGSFNTWLDGWWASLDNSLATKRSCVTELSWSLQYAHYHKSWTCYRIHQWPYGFGNAIIIDFLICRAVTSNVL